MDNTQFQVWEVLRRSKRKMYNISKLTMINIKQPKRSLSFTHLLLLICLQEFTTDKLKAILEKESNQLIETQHRKVHQKSDLINILSLKTAMFYIQMCFRKTRDNKENGLN